MLKIIAFKIYSNMKLILNWFDGLYLFHSLYIKSYFYNCYTIAILGLAQRLKKMHKRHS